MLITAIVLVLVYVGLVLGLQRGMLFPRHLTRMIPRGNVEGLEEIWLGQEEKVEAWYLPPLHGAGPAPVLIFTHGNGELIDYWPEQFETPRRWGIAVLLVEYPGYGRSPGHPSEKTITATMLAAYDAVVQKPEVDPARVVAYGRSVGGGAACALAAKRPVAALILESTFTSVRPLARRMGVPGFLIRDPFDNLKTVSEFDRPILLMHGEYDQIIAAEHSRQLHEAAAESKLVLLPCGHNDCERPWDHIRSFLQEHQLSDPAE